MSEVNEGRIIREFGKYEKTLALIYSSIKDPANLEKYSEKEFSNIIKLAFEVSTGYDTLVHTLNKLNSDKCPFNLFKGDIGRVRNVELGILSKIAFFVQAINTRYCNKEIKDDEWNRIYQLTLAEVWCSIHYFKLLRKIVQTGLVPEKFKTKPFFERLLSDSPLSHPHKNLELEVKVNDATVEFDKDLLNWISLLILLHAENAAVGLKSAQIAVGADYHGDSKFYLNISNNGKKMHEIGGDAITIQCRESIPKILALLNNPDTSFRIKDSERSFVTTNTYASLHTEALLRLPLAKKTLTPDEREYIVKEFGACEKTLTRLYGAIKDKNDLKRYSAAYYDRLAKLAYGLFNRSKGLSYHINQVNSNECPFNIFQGHPQLAHHAADSTLAKIAMTVDSIKYDFFDEGGRKHGAEVNEKIYEGLLAQVYYSINCFRAFEKIATAGYVPEKFSVKPFLEKLLRDRLKLAHHEYFKPKANLEDAIVEFDKEALYWIVMRMLSNAEHATIELEKTGKIEVLTRHRDGNLYLVVRNNGKTMAERAKESVTRGGGKSRPNIEKICEELDANFVVRDSKSKDFTVTACIRLPLAKEQGPVGKWAK